MNAQNELIAFRNNVKDSICSMLVSIYLAKHNGVMPDWSRGEEIIVEDTDSDNCHTTIMLNVGNTYDECVAPYEVCIDRFIVTLDENLYLYSTENGKEYHWSKNGEEHHWEDVNTDDLVKIHDLIARYYKSTLITNSKSKNMERITESVVNEWWDNCGFKEMEIITGFRMTDFDPEDGYQEFVDICDEWWDKLSFSEKKEFYNRWN